MRAHVNDKVAVLIEPLLALGTLEWFFVRVNARVCFQLPGKFESLLADGAHVRPRFPVHFQVRR